MSKDLIGRADSLMRRGRTFVAGQPATAPADDGIPLLTEVIDFEALTTTPEPEDLTDEITAAVTARVTAEVTADVTGRVTADVTRRVTEQVSTEVGERVTEEVGRRVRDEVRDEFRHTASDALTGRFADLAELIQSLIDDWSTTTLPALVGIELRAALEAAMSEAVQNAAARIREQAVLDLRDSIAGEVEARSMAVLDAILSGKPDGST